MCLEEGGERERDLKGRWREEAEEREEREDINVMPVVVEIIGVIVEECWRVRSWMWVESLPAPPSRERGRIWRVVRVRREMV